jgi:uncharacterized repeat protein (TIGR01451 family)
MLYLVTIVCNLVKRPVNSLDNGLASRMTLVGPAPRGFSRGELHDGFGGESMRIIATRLAALATLFLLQPHSGSAQQPSQPPILSLGNAVVTGFSGTVAPDPRRVPRDKTAIDLTFIDPDAASARIFDVRTPGFTWDGRNWQAPKTLDVFARDAGQVFGIALDDEASPNIYLTATSAYGLQIVVPGADGTPQRVTKGQPRAEWMKGQFGPAPQGGPGSIWKVDGRTGQVSLFASVALNGASNSGPGLGNIAYDRAHRQLFVSDLATGMIHRFDLAGRELQVYDHGTAARPARSLPPVAFDLSRRVEITDSRFDSENPDSWGFAVPERRVYAVMIRQEGQDTRLYYSVWDGPQIWSVGVQPDGSIGSDPRWELDVAATPRSFPVSDMAFTDQGAMILAQRGGIVSSYDYSVFARPGEARVLRYALEQPDDPATPSRWIAQPDEYAIGFRGDFRNTDGGVDLGYGWRDGRIDTNSCATTLWTTGESLRDNPAFATRLQPGGPFTVNGLQASPADQVRDQNTPPWTAYFIDYDSRYNDARASGHIGSVRILRTDCAAPPMGPIAGPGITTLPPSGPPLLCPQGLNPDGTCGRVLIDLAIRKTASERKFDPATGTWTFQFTLQVTNVGAPFTGQNVIQVTDPVPTGMTFTSATGVPWACTVPPAISSGTLTCTYTGNGPTASGQSLGTITITATTKTAGKYENCATVGTPKAPWLQETTLANNRSCATVDVPVDLAIKKTAGDPKFDEKTGTWSFQYTLTITNVGAANNGPIQVNDPVPAGLTFASVTAAGWTCTPATPLSSGALNCTHPGPIAYNQTFTITITVTGKTPGKYENCATVNVTAASGLQETTQANNRGCATVEFHYPPNNVTVVKTGPLGGPCAVASSCMFTITVTNNSPWPFNGPVSVGDNTGVPMTIASTDLPCSPPPTATPFTCTAALNMPAGPSTQTFTISGVIPAGSVPETSQSAMNCFNLGQAPPNSPWPGGIPSTIVNDTKDCKQYIVCGFQCHMTQPQIDQIKIDKKANSAECSPGGLCSFTYTVSNLSATTPTAFFPITFLSAMPAGAATFVPPPAPFPPWSCIPFGPPGEIKCLHPPSSIPAGGHLTVTVTFMISPNYAQPTLTNCAEFFVGNPQIAAAQRRVRDAMSASALREYLQSRGAAPTSASALPVLGPDDKSCATVKISGTKTAIDVKIGKENTPAGGSGRWFNLWVSNVGAPITFPAAGVTVTDNIPAGMTVTSVVSPNWTCTPGTLVGPGTLTCKYNLAGSLATNTDILNSIVVNYTTTGPGPFQNCATVGISAAVGVDANPANNTACVMVTATPLPTTGLPLACDPRTAVKRGNECVCLFANMVKSSAQACACAAGLNFIPGRGCVPLLVCSPPKVPNATNTACVCPEGTIPRGNECVKPPVCPPPLISAPGPAPGIMNCVCPPGTVKQGQTCVKPPVCQPPMVLGPAGECICRPPLIKRGNDCVPPQRACQPPMVPGPGGECICRPPLVKRGNDCVPPQRACQPPMVLGPAGECICRPPLVKRGNECVHPGPTQGTEHPGTPGPGPGPVR